MDQIPLNDYFARIGFDGAARPDLETLAALNTLHAHAIPFEGLDPFAGRPVHLDAATLHGKLIASRRGGYCFEHNTLFKAVLEQIGFPITGLGGRVRWMSPPDSPLGPRDHMLLKVEVDAAPYLVDVGFGACLLDAPLRFTVGEEQRTALGTFRLDETGGLFSLSARQPEGWRTMYVFNLEPQIASDYEMGNWYTSTSPKVPFGQIVIIERLAGGRRAKLINTRFILEGRDGAVLEERILASAQELEQVLGETFGIAPPLPPAEIFARISSPPGSPS